MVNDDNKVIVIVTEPSTTTHNFTMFHFTDGAIKFLLQTVALNLLNLEELFDIPFRTVPNFDSQFCQPIFKMLLIF